MNFAHPAFLFFAAAVPFAAFMAAYALAKREKAMLRMTSAPPENGRAHIQLLLLSVSLALLFVACARPQWGKTTVREPVSNRNVVVALDVSRSMLAEDVRPNRLERAKADIADLIDSLEGDRCSLVAFRRTGVALCPLTTDRSFLRATLEKTTVDSAPRGETDFKSAIEESLNVIGQMDGRDGEKADHSAIIIVSDGGDLRGGAEEGARKAKKRGVPVFTVGIGNPRAESPVPDGKGGYQQYKGRTVTTKLDDSVLETIARESGGKYIPLATAGTADTTLGAIYRSFLRQVAAEERNREELRLAERYQLFLFPALAFAIAAACLSKGRYSIFKPRRAAASFLLAASALLSGCVCTELDGDTEISGCGLESVQPANGVWDREYGTSANPLDCSFVFRVARFRDGIGVKATVRDDALVTDDCLPGDLTCRSWDDDNIEIFFDGDNDSNPDFWAGSGRIFGGEYVLVANGAAQSDRSSCPKSFGTDWRGSVKRTSLDNGYLIEYDLFFTWKCLGFAEPPPLEKAVIFGFNISAHDDDDGGRADKALYWVGNPDMPYRDESRFRKITLKGVDSDKLSRRWQICPALGV